MAIVADSEHTTGLTKDEDTVDLPHVRSTAHEELVRSVVSADAGEEGKCCTGNVKVLSLTAFLFGLITAVQYYFGGVVTHSQALLADCNSMLVDALSYFLNIFAELSPPKWKRPLQLTVPFVSLTVLTILTVQALQEAIGTLSGEEGDDDDVKPVIVWGFGFAGMVFDLISIVAFYRNMKKQRARKLQVNMLAAFMHVGADCIRSLTTFVEGFFLMADYPPNMDSGLVDAWACVIITVVIFIGVAYGLFEVISDWITYCKTGK